MHKFNVGDRFYSLWNHDVFTIMGEREGCNEVTFEINWRKHDNYREEHPTYPSNKYDGHITCKSLETGNLGYQPFYKIKDDKHLLELILRHGK